MAVRVVLGCDRWKAHTGHFHRNQGIRVWCDGLSEDSPAWREVVREKNTPKS